MGRNLFADDYQQTPKRTGRNLFADVSQEEESALSKLPRNIVTGLAQGGHTALNLPHDLVQNLEQQGQKFGESINKTLPLEKYGVQSPQYNVSLSNKIPYQEDYNFAQMLGQKGQGTFLDKAIQKGSEYAPELLLGVNALKDVIPHLTKRGATKKLRRARDLEAERDIGTLNVNPELIEDARQYLPNNLPERNLLSDSQAGDYNSLFDLQSLVGKISSQRMGKIRSLFSPEAHIKGESGLASRRRLLDAIHENLQSQGHHDISDLLRQGQNDYRRYKKFRPYSRAIAGAGVTAAAAPFIPKNALTDLIKKLWSHGGQ